MIPDFPHDIRIRLAQLRLSNVRMQHKTISILPILFLYYEESLVSSNLNSNILWFHCVRPKLDTPALHVYVGLTLIQESRVCRCTLYINNHKLCFLLWTLANVHDVTFHNGWNFQVLSNKYETNSLVEKPSIFVNLLLYFLNIRFSLCLKPFAI